MTDFRHEVPYTISEQAGFFLLSVCEENRISDLQYKMISNREEGVFLPCRRILVDDVTTFVYPMGTKHRLSEIKKSLSPEAAATLLLAILDAVKELNEDGYLSCRNLILDANAVFADAGGGNPKLVYCPVQPAGDSSSFSLQLTMLIQSFLEGTALGEDTAWKACSDYIRTEQRSAEDILGFMYNALSAFKGPEKEADKSVSGSEGTWSHPPVLKRRRLRFRNRSSGSAGGRIPMISDWRSGVSARIIVLSGSMGMP